MFVSIVDSRLNQPQILELALQHFFLRLQNIALHFQVGLGRLKSASRAGVRKRAAAHGTTTTSLSPLPSPSLPLCLGPSPTLTMALSRARSLSEAWAERSPSTPPVLLAVDSGEPGRLAAALRASCGREMGASELTTGLAIPCCLFPPAARAARTRSLRFSVEISSSMGRTMLRSNSECCWAWVMVLSMSTGCDSARTCRFKSDKTQNG